MKYRVAHLCMQGKLVFRTDVPPATNGRMLRLFTALHVPEHIADTLSRRQSGLPGARWRPLEALHITLAFYGDATERQADELASALTKAEGRGPLELELNGVGAFGDNHQSHTLWAGVKPSEPLNLLAARCKSAGERAGVPPERRDYRPHVTLAYLKPHTDPDRIGAWMTGHNMLQSPPIRFDRFGLYSSVVTAEGSAYHLEQEYFL